MRKLLAVLLSVALVLTPVASPASGILIPPVDNDRPEYLPPDELTPEQEQAMWAAISDSVTRLRAAGLLAAPDVTQTVTYTFPLRMAPGLYDYAGFRVSAFVDHDPAAGTVKDYMGGSRTYDSHRGTDYALSPFPWNKLDAGAVQVIAAAAGTIVYKGDTDATDHNPCDGGTNSDNWNYVAIAHADGRMTIYGHMRYHSLTVKNIGQTVAQGEYLGTAASSGNSSGPHLHFEARVDSTPQGAWIDPYAGPYSQAESLWAAQRPYYDSAINLLATHSAPPVTAACPPSTPNFQNNYALPATVYVYAYYRDFQGALPTQFALYRPDGSLFDAWQYSSATSFASPWYASKAEFLAANEAPGSWRLTANYNSQNYEAFFNVGTLTVTVASPNGGEQWDVRLSHSIVWSDNLANDVSIALYHNGTLSATLAAATPSDGQWEWVPGLAFPPGSGYTIRVTNLLSPAVFDESNLPFDLVPTTLTLPLYLPNVAR